MAAAGAAARDREVIVDQLAATAGEDRRPIDQARSLLLAAVGRKPPDAAAVWNHAAADGHAGATDWVGGWPANRLKSRAGRRGLGEIALERGSFHFRCARARASPASSGGRLQ